MSTTLQTTVVMTSHDQAEAEAEMICEREWRLIINTVAAGALCLVGLFGNTASYRVLGRDTEILPVPRFLFWALHVDNTEQCTGTQLVPSFLIWFLSYPVILVLIP